MPSSHRLSVIPRSRWPDGCWWHDHGNSGTSTGAASGPGVSGILAGGYYVQPYSAALQSSFGTPPYTYALVGGGLPPGTAINSAGKITGTPGDTGTFNFQVKATDSSKPPVSKTLVLVEHLYRIRHLRRSDRGTLGEGGHGYFRLERQNGRWKLVSPTGNNFYLLSVFNANYDFMETGVIPQRYHDDASLWATHRGQRMLSWGFNSLGEYTGYVDYRSERGATRMAIRSSCRSSYL